MATRKIINTADGAVTIYLPDWNEYYHSRHGAIWEAYHVFITHGLALFPRGVVNVLEIGFGTGLNAFISFLETVKRPLKVSYTGIEAYPMSMNEIQKLNYISKLNAETFKREFYLLHETVWEERHEISRNFSLIKRKQFFKDICDTHTFHLIYFDAFGARVQPELWTEAIFQLMYNALRQKGVLVTYAAKGSVRRAMQAVGFTVERLPGPPGKREMLRARKI
ncbi:MAG: tRNA (5-methylaminomethyl-2-thiouridine)(34)-methyltransferase MnmD [Flavobacteriaceae bacterium]|nr:MAG: tRNA (5-methylaminomethyl-2-thiouridine)(34)-methyltransferase MnmD [Flavobacteriaceae bacterium]